jgi:hypothetical protein
MKALAEVIHQCFLAIRTRLSIDVFGQLELRENKHHSDLMASSKYEPCFYSYYTAISSLKELIRFAPAAIAPSSLRCSEPRWRMR